MEPVPARFPPRQQVQVWHGGGPALWHGVRRESDSLSGIPYHQPIDCAGCRVSLPTAAVDSVRLGDLERPGMLLGAAPFVAMAVAALAIRLSWGSD